MQRITAENFITEDRTNKVYLSSLIDKATGDLDEETRGLVKKRIAQFAPSCELLYNTMDVWARDYMPIQLTKDVYLGYTYMPDYLKEEYQEYATNWQLHHVHTQKQLRDDKKWGFKVVQMPIILDGGNVIKAIVEGKPCIIMCDKVLAENNVTDEDFCNWWDEWWSENFDGTEMRLVLLPWEGHEKNPIGHADGMVRFIEEGRVLMANYGDLDGNSYPSGVMKDRLSWAGFEVEELSYIKQFDLKTDKLFQLLFDHTWSYINYLQLGNRILVPSLGYPALDKEAIRQVDHAFNKNHHIADIELIDVDMTSIIAGNGNNTNSGGALNCLSWTVIE